MREGLASLSVVVWGRVQGVFFRAFVRQQALNLGLKGYVRNLPDGGVQVGAEGQRKRLEELLFQLKRGPRGSRVDGLEAVWSEYRGEFAHFDITY